MKRRLWTFAAASLLAAAAAAGQQKPATPEQPPPVFRSEANFVRLDVYPTKDDRPVAGLTVDDFEVLEDGVPQRIQSFEHVVIATGTPPDARIEPNSAREGERMAANPRNRVFVVFLDVPHVNVASSHAIKEPLIKLFGRLMGPDDLVAVMTPSMAPTDMTFGRKTEIIERGLRDNWAWGERGRLVMGMDERERDYDLCYPPRGAGQESPLAKEMKERRRERMVLEALHDMVRYLGGIREERKAIITVTEGWPLYTPKQSLMDLGEGERVPGADPIGVGPDGRLRRDPATTRTDNAASKYACDTDRMALAAMDNERYFRDLLDVANRANASFYPIDPRGLPVFDDDVTSNVPPAVSHAKLRDRHVTLRTLAENTDGLAILDNNNLDRGLKRVSDDLTSYYLLGYYSTNTKFDGRFRSLKVRVKAPGVNVRARRGYLAATAAEVSAARSAAPAGAPGGAGAVASAIADLARIRSEASLVLHAIAAGEAAVWVAGEIPAGKESASGGTATIEVTGGKAAATTAKAELKPGERAFLIRIPLAAPAPQAEIRGRFVRPDSPVPMSFTTRIAAMPRPLLFRRGPSTGNRPVPAASFQFSRTERLRLELPLGAADTPGAGRVLDRTGQALQVPVTISERTDAESGQRWLVADVTLAALGMGEYAIEIVVGESKILTGVRVGR